MPTTTETKTGMFRGFREPLEVVDRTDIPYGERLALLQEWQARLAREGAPEPARGAVQGAIHALEIGSEAQQDEPGEAPRGHGYGAPRP